MDHEGGTPKMPDEVDTLSAEERAALVGEWRKNRPDLSWQPLEGRELDVLLPLKNKLFGAFVFVVFAVSIIAGLFFSSAPREVREVTGTVMVAGKPDEEGIIKVIVALPGEEPRMMTYPGNTPPKAGDEVVLEATQLPLVPWQSYRFKEE